MAMCVIKQCVINAFDTDFILSADRVMGNIIHQVQNLDFDVFAKSDSADLGLTINAFLADRKRQGGRGIGGWTTDKKKSKFAMKCGACGDPYHVWSTCKAPDADVLHWTLAKRKQIAEKYAGQPPLLRDMVLCDNQVATQQCWSCSIVIVRL
jgi:hypothetical protein